MNFTNIKVGDSLSYIMRGINEDGEKLAIEITATVTSVKPITEEKVEENSDD